MAIQNANKIAGKRRRFCVLLLKAGGCWKMDRRRVRTAMRLNHCLTQVSPYSPIPGEDGKRFTPRSDETEEKKNGYNSHHNKIDKEDRARFIKSVIVIIRVDIRWNCAKPKPQY